LHTNNDGFGNAVELGIVAANGPDDPYGLYGECAPAYWSDRGFLSKSSLIVAAGQNLDRVTGIEIVSCGPIEGSPALGGPLKRISCADINSGLPTAFKNRFDYCIGGEDSKRNQVAAGVRE
jgi:hypothetical protein